LVFQLRILFSDFHCSEGFLETVDSSEGFLSWFLQLRILFSDFHCSEGFLEVVDGSEGLLSTFYSSEDCLVIFIAQKAFYKL